MLKIYIIVVFILLNGFLGNAQNKAVLANNYYNDGVEYLNNGNFRYADSLFTLSLNIFPDIDAFFNRALARKKLGNEAGFCMDIFMSTANGDSVSRNVFLKRCTLNDTIYLDSFDQEVSKLSSVKTKIIAKRKFDSNTDIVIIDSLGNQFWDNEKDTTLLTPEDSIAMFKSEIMPSFPGGEDALVNFLARNIRYPPKARDSGLQGTVFVTFVINKEGYVEQIKVLRGVVEEIDREAMRVVSGMPQWFPGMQDKRFVKVQYNLPIRFTLH